LHSLPAWRILRQWNYGISTQQAAGPPALNLVVASPLLALAAVFSLGPREGAPVSTPLCWCELKPGFKSERWNLHSVLEDLPRRSKLWEGFFTNEQTLEGALMALDQSRVA